MTRALMAVAVVVVLIVVVVVGVVLARAPQAVKPGAEIKKLGLFLGSWNVEGELKPGNGYGVPAGNVISGTWCSLAMTLAQRNTLFHFSI